MQRSMKTYVQAISKRTEAQGKEKNQNLPIAFLGSTMVAHGEDFDPDSEFGQCLSSKQPYVSGYWMGLISI